MQTAWKEYQEKNQQRFLDEMLELLRIPSISAKSERKDDMRKCAELVKQRLLDSGADKAEVMSTDGHPVVYGEKIIDPEKPTVLVYGHYDVQPPEPLELWHSGPFEPVIKEGKVYAYRLLRRTVICCHGSFIEWLVGAARRMSSTKFY